MLVCHTNLEAFQSFLRMLWLAALWWRQFTLNFKNFNRTSGDKTCETKVVGHTNIGLHIKFGGFSINFKNVMACRTLAASIHAKF